MHESHEYKIHKIYLKRNLIRTVSNSYQTRTRFKHKGSFRSFKRCSRSEKERKERKNSSTDSTKINLLGYNIRLYWPNFDIRPFVYNKIFLKKLLQMFEVQIFTLLLALFVPKLVNISRHSESLKYVWKSTNRCYRRKMSSILEFFRMFKDSLWRE